MLHIKQTNKHLCINMRNTWKVINSTIRSKISTRTDKFQKKIKKKKNKTKQNKTTTTKTKQSKKPLHMHN